MKRIFLLLLCLALLCTVLCACRADSPTPDAEQLAAWGIEQALPKVARLLDSQTTDTALRLFYQNAERSDLDALVSFLKEQGYTNRGGASAEIKESVSGRYLSFTAEREWEGKTLIASAAYFLKDGSFDGEKMATGEMLLKFSVKKADTPETDANALPSSTDYTLPQNVAVTLSLAGERVYSVKIGEDYYSERHGISYFYAKNDIGYTEYVLEGTDYVTGRHLDSRIAVEYLVFGMMLDAGEFDFAAFGEAEEILHFERQMLRYTDAHEGIEDTVVYDPVSRLIFVSSTVVDGFSSSIHEVTAFDETVTDFGTLPLPPRK